MGGVLFCGMVEELLPSHKRLSVPRQCLPVLWTTGEATLTRFAAINWRTRGFFSGNVSDFISAFRRTPDDTFINENELVAKAAMVVDWDGKSISEELIHGMGNVSALSWMSHGRARRGVAAKIQDGVYFWSAIHRIPIAPFYLRASRNITSDFLTRATEAEINQRASAQVTERVRLCHR